MTSWVFLWEGADGERRWEAVKEGQTGGFLERLITSGVHPATVMVAYNPIFFHWVWKEFHKGLSDVFFGKINKEIYGTEPVEESKHKPVDVPIKKKVPEAKFGWIAPDGRYFQCNYGGHSTLARRIVGEVQHISDPEQHLEGLEWVKVFSGTGTEKRYTVGMGTGKKLTDAQLRTLQEEGLDHAHGISLLL